MRKIKKSSNLLLQLNEIKKDDNDFTLKYAKFIIMDVALSGNGQVLEKDVIESGVHTLKNKPIVAKYYPIKDGDDDHLGTHEEYIGTNRKGDNVLTSNTVTIGHFISDGYIEEYNGVDTLFADGVLHAEKYPDVIGLIEEWLEDGKQVNSSIEYYYSNYEIKDGIEYVKAPIVFAQHCILNSEERDGYPVVDGAYANSQILSINEKEIWNQSLNKIKEREGVGMKMYKKVCELSHDDVRSKIYQAIDAKNEASEEYTYSWIADTYDDKFIAEEETGYFEYKYTNSDDVITIDFDSKTEVKAFKEWRTVEDTVAKLELSLSEKTVEVEDLNVKVEELTVANTEIEAAKEEVEAAKVEVEESLNAKVEELKSANEKVESLNAISEKYEAEENAKKLANAQELYKDKFASLNAMDKFESEEVQAMIADSVTDETKVASLNAMIVELVVMEKSTNDNSKGASENITKSMNSLIPESGKTIESKYFSK